MIARAASQRAAGDATFDLRHTALIGNGSFTSEDFDDGIDVDEAGDGDLIGRFHHVMASKNFEQGVDLNENASGDLRGFMADVTAAENQEEGIEFEEDDDGDAGLKLREKGEGNRLHGWSTLADGVAATGAP